jgi:hypothetical protein
VQITIRLVTLSVNPELMKLAGLLLPQIIGARRLDRPVGEWTPAVLVPNLRHTDNVVGKLVNF